MVRLRRPGSAQVLCDQGLFRATSALQILSGLGKVFAEGLTGVIGAAQASDALGTVQAAAGDTAFMGTEPVNQVEVFISHTWGSARWQKYMSEGNLCPSSQLLKVWSEGCFSLEAPGASALRA
eukprot:s149_g8.t1